MSKKVTVTGATQPTTGPNSRLRMGENVMAVLRVSSITVSSNNTANTN